MKNNPCLYKNKQGLSRLSILGIVAMITGLLILAYVLYSLNLQKFKQSIPEKIDEKNVQREILDEYGCAVNFGYSWCEVLNRCIATSTQECMDEEMQVSAYLKENISKLSPKKEVLGGKFFVTDIRFGENNVIEVDFEDGHIALSAYATYVIKNGRVYIQKFLLKDPYDIKVINGDTEVLKIASTTGLLKGEEKILVEARELLAYEYGVLSEKVIARLSAIRGGFARGEMVVYSNANETRGDFFLREINDNYELIETSVANMDCIALIDFPKEMVPECAGLE